MGHPTLNGEFWYDDPTNQDPSTNKTISDLKTAVNSLPDQTALNYILSKLDGYWTSGQQFAGFNSQSLEYGLLQSGFGVIGQITDSGILGTNSFYIELFIPARAATEMDDAQPARSESISIDISTFNQDHRLNIKIENLGDGDWQTYDFAGKSLEEIN